MRQSMLAQILSAEARERMSRISIVKPEKAKQVEDMLINMARRGQVRQQIQEQDLIEFLAQIPEKKTEIVYSRRRDDFDSDSDDF